MLKFSHHTFIQILFFVPIGVSHFWQLLPYPPLDRVCCNDTVTKISIQKRTPLPWEERSIGFDSLCLVGRKDQVNSILSMHNLCIQGKLRTIVCTKLTSWTTLPYGLVHFMILYRRITNQHSKLLNCHASVASIHKRG